jgi:hypothetical protein
MFLSFYDEWFFFLSYTLDLGFGNFMHSFEFIMPLGAFPVFQFQE